MLRRGRRLVCFILEGRAIVLCLGRGLLDGCAGRGYRRGSRGCGRGVLVSRRRCRISLFVVCLRLLEMADVDGSGLRTRPWTREWIIAFHGLTILVWFIKDLWSAGGIG